MLMKKEVIEDNENLKKEIKDLKKQLEEEKNAYNRMYNMYVEKEEELKELNEIERIGRERHYHSKFLKDFQKERGKNVFPDHDEIYKRYDDYKSRIEKAIEYIKENKWFSYTKNHEIIDEKGIEDLLEILKGEDKE